MTPFAPRIRGNTTRDFFTQAPSFNYEPQSREDIARQQGWNIVGDRASKTTQFGQKIGRSINDASFRDPDRPGMLNQMGDALGFDMQRQESSASDLFDRKADAISRFDRDMRSDERNVRRGLDTSLGIIDEERDRAGGDLITFDKQATETLSTMDKGLAESDRLSQQGLRVMGNATAEYETTMRDNIVAAKSGLEARVNSSLKDIDSGLTPDGRMMSPAERAQARAQVVGAATREIGDMTTSLWQNTASNIAGLKSQLAQMTAGAAALKQQGTSQRAGVASGLASNRLQGSIEMSRVREGLASLSANLRTATELSLMQAKMGGNQTVYQMQDANRYGNVSVFAGLAQMYALATAPGAGRVNGIGVPQQPVRG
mgnify:CR=1 FL=1